MKKFIVSLFAVGVALLSCNTSSAQFISTSCEWQVHCSAPTRWVAYKTTAIYIWDQGDEFDLGFQQNFDKQKTLLLEIFITENKTFSEEEITSKITENLPELQKADTLIINTAHFDVLFQFLGKINMSNNLHLQDKTIYLVTDSNTYFLKRTLAKQIKSMDIQKIYTLPDAHFLNFLSTLSLNKLTNHEAYITPFSLSFHETPKFLIVSYLIDHLIYNGFPIDLLSFFLILSLWALIISIFRQMIGFSVFGIYTPLLFAVSLSIFGIPLSLWLLGIGFLSKLLVKLFTKKMYLLHNAKTSLLIIIYFLLVLLILGLDTIFGFTVIDFSLFSNAFIILPTLFIIIVSDKVFNEWFKLFSAGRWVAFAEFLIVSFSVFGLFYRTWLKQILLAFPEILILIFLLNIAVGRFTGLQLLEYFRFMPLLKNSSGTEEEEE